MRGTDLAGSKSAKLQNFIMQLKNVNCFCPNCGEETEYAEISKYGRSEKGYDTGQESIVWARTGLSNSRYIWTKTLL